MRRPAATALVVGLVAGAAIVSTLVAVLLGVVLRPGPTITSDRAAQIALAQVQRNRYNNHPVTGWTVDSVDWDPTGDIAFHMPNGGAESAPCRGTFGFGCGRRQLWYVRLHAPAQADGSTHDAEIYVDAHTGSVVGQGGTAFTGAGGGPPPGVRSSPVPPG